MKIININYKDPNIDAIKKVADVIKKGEMAIVPGDAVYTLVGDATNMESIKKINQIKKRDKGKAFNLGLGNLSDINNYGYYDNRILKIQEMFPDEPFTFVVKRKNGVLPVSLNPSYKKLGFRVPFNKVTSTLSKFNPTPVIGTSANVSGFGDSHSTSEVIEYFKKNFGEELCPKLFLNAGQLEERKPSTVIDVSENKIKIIRKGEIDEGNFYQKIKLISI